ncbi:hypothetical protein C8R47DRAFT_1109389 [Mycena vitilis]|nr:hypothetical protein C8R47DRAFT_1109389 [Mycena vitilis]
MHFPNGKIVHDALPNGPGSSRTRFLLNTLMDWTYELQVRPSASRPFLPYKTCIKMDPGIVTLGNPIRNWGSRQQVDLSAGGFMWGRKKRMSLQHMAQARVERDSCVHIGGRFRITCIRAPCTSGSFLLAWKLLTLLTESHNIAFARGGCKGG